MWETGGDEGVWGVNRSLRTKRHLWIWALGMCAITEWWGKKPSVINGEKKSELCQLPGYHTHTQCKNNTHPHMPHKHSFIHTHTHHTHGVNRDRAWHLKGKADIDSITVTVAAIKQQQILKHFSSVLHYWHQKLFSPPSDILLNCCSSPQRPHAVTKASKHIGSWCGGIRVRLPFSASLSCSPYPLL